MRRLVHVYTTVLILILLPVASGSSCVIVELPSETWYAVFKPVSPDVYPRSYYVDADGNIYAVLPHPTCEGCIVFANVSRSGDSKALLINLTPSRLITYAHITVRGNLVYISLVRYVDVFAYNDLLVIEDTSVQVLASAPQPSYLAVPLGDSVYFIPYEFKDTFWYLHYTNNSLLNTTVSLNPPPGTCFIHIPRGVTLHNDTVYVSAMCSANSITVISIRGERASSVVIGLPKFYLLFNAVARFVDDKLYVATYGCDDSCNSLVYVIKVSETLDTAEGLLIRIPVLYVWSVDVTSNRTHLLVSVSVYSDDTEWVVPGLIAVSKEDGSATGLVFSKLVDADIETLMVFPGVSEFYLAYDPYIHVNRTELLVVHGFSYCNVTAYPATEFTPIVERVTPAYMVPEYTVSTSVVQQPPKPEYTVTPVNLGDYVSIEKVVLWSGTCPVCVEPKLLKPPTKTETATEETTPEQTQKTQRFCLLLVLVLMIPPAIALSRTLSRKRITNY